MGTDEATPRGGREATLLAAACAVMALPVLWAVLRTAVEAGPYLCPDGTRGTVVRAFGAAVVSGKDGIRLAGRGDACGGRQAR